MSRSCGRAVGVSLLTAALAIACTGGGASVRAAGGRCHYQSPGFDPVEGPDVLTRSVDPK